jgi:hypothetical protein
MTMTIEGPTIPDNKFASEIPELVRNTESSLLFHHSSRPITGARLPAGAVA